MDCNNCMFFIKGNTSEMCEISGEYCFNGACGMACPLTKEAPSISEIYKMTSILKGDEPHSLSNREEGD